MIKVGAGSNYDDGDVLCAFNRRAIRCVHAQHICHYRRAKRNVSGLILNTEVARDYFELTHQYRFERVSADTVKRVILSSGAEELLGNTPNGSGERIDVRAYVRRRKLQPNHRLFGEDGREVWYGGSVDLSSRVLDRIWAKIEEKTAHRESSYDLWPAGVLDLKHHLMIPVADFDDATAEQYVRPVLDETNPDNPIRLKKRAVQVANLADIATDLGVTESSIRDREQSIDKRREAQPINLSTRLRDKTAEVRNAALDLDTK
ncbi:hypothetical protein [Petrachloros mirabilis]